jgi:dual-specificity kinase
VARLIEILCERSTSKTAAHHATRPARKCSRNHVYNIANRFSAARYFKNYKLDYPNADTNKASKKYVKAMKKLPVRLITSCCLIAI